MNSPTPPFKSGDKVVIVGWRSKRSLDFRTVVGCWSERNCQGGWMIRIDEPLHHGSVTISAAWARAAA